MRSLLCTLLALATATLATANEAPSPGDAILGRWFDENQKARIEIYSETTRDGDPVYHAKIIWLADPYYRGEGPEYGHPLRDANNPDKSRRHDPILGLRVISDMKYNAKKKRWQGGKVYDPESGKEYRATIKHSTTKSNQEKLTIRGYVLVRLIGRNTTWTRVPEDFEPPDPPPQFPDK